MNEPYRLRYTNQIVGAFLAIFLLFLIVLLLLVFRVGDRFGEKDLYYLDLTEEEIGDLYRGAEVVILGENAGQVKSIEYADAGNVRVELQIDRDKSDMIFDDSVVWLERKLGVGGAPVLVIRRGRRDGGESNPLPPDSELLNFEGDADRVDQLSREVESIAESIRSIEMSAVPSLESVDNAADRFQGTLDNSADPAFDRTREASESFLVTNDRFRQATETIEARIVSLTEKVELLVEQDMKRTLAEVQESSNDFSDAAISVNQTSDNIDRDVADTLVQMREAIEQVRVLAEETRDVIRIVRQEANDLPGTTARVNDTVSDTQEMVGEIRSHWLLRRYSNQGNPSQQVSPSSVRGGSAR